MNWYKTSQQTHTAPPTPVKPDLVTTPDEVEFAKGFTEHYVIFRFDNGWTIQKVEKDFDYESDFLEINSYVDNKHNEHAYSLRNEYNVPRANFVVEISKKDPSYFGMREVNYKYIPEQKFHNEKYCNTLLKQFFDYLKSLGMKPKWIDEQPDTDRIEIRDLKDYIVDDMGIPPIVFGRDEERNSFSIGGDSDSYYEALKQAYSEAISGSNYYSRVANGLIDDIFSFAEVREEVGLLDDAVQSLEEWANNAYFETDWGEELPSRPEEPTKEEFTKEYQENPNQPEFNTKDMKKAKNPFFDEKAYNDAVKEYNRLLKEYDEKEAELQEYFEPNQFGNTAYKKLQELKARLSLQKPTKSKTTKK